MEDQKSIDLINNKNLIDQLPKNIDLGFCPVGQEISKSFYLKNYDSKSKEFSFESPIVKVDPMKEIINSKSKFLINISITLHNASVIVTKLIFRVNNEEKLIKVSAIGKFPFLKIIKREFNFDSLNIGKQNIKELLIKNLGEVGTFFKIVKINNTDFNDNSFKLDYYDGYIPSKSNFLIKIKFKPELYNIISNVNFKIKCIGGNEIYFQCKGIATEIDVSLDKNIIIFKSIKKNQNITESFSLLNNSNVKIYYQIFNTQNAFKLNKRKGIIKENNNLNIKVTFFPNKVINYRERIFILIKNHKLLIIDLFGNCQDLLYKPVTSENIILKSVLGLEEEIIDIQEEEEFPKIKFDGHSINKTKSTSRMFNTRFINKNKDLLDEFYFKEQNEIHNLFFNKENNLNKLFIFSNNIFDFDKCNINIEKSKDIIIKNTSDQLLYFYAIIELNTNFNLSQTEFLIYPNKEIAIELKFIPKSKFMFYFKEIQFLITNENLNKKQSKLKLNPINIINNDLFTFEYKIKCIGNTFIDSSQTYIPMINLFPSNFIKFTPNLLNEYEYQTLIINNKGNTPCLFKILDSIKNIKVFPKVGFIKENSFQMILIRYYAIHIGLFNENLLIKFNNLSEINKIKLIAYTDVPNIELENDNKIFFSPSYLGVYNKLEYKIYNRSLVKAKLFIDIPEKYNNELFLNNPYLDLNPNEYKKINIHFIPLKKEKYKISCPIQVHDENDKYIEEKILRIYGEGGDGSLSIIPNILDFGIIKVNFEKTMKITLINNSDISFYISLEIQPIEKENNNKYNNEIINIVKKSFNLDFNEGLINSRSKKDINITFKPFDIYNLEINLVCKTCDNNKTGKFIKTDNIIYTPKTSSKIIAKGNYPVLKIVDIRNKEISVSNLWENFELNQINNELDKSLTQNEKYFNNIEKLNQEQAKDVHNNLMNYKWNFGYVQNKNKSMSRKIYISFKNIGGTDLEWKIKFPDDSNIITEPWNNGENELNNKKILEKNIIEKNIFEVNPREGRLNPNQECVIELIYNTNIDDEIYDNNGERKIEEAHNIETILHIYNGKAIKLNFNGITIAPLQSRLALKKINHILPKVPIGMPVAAFLPIEIQNFGSSKLRYKINKENFYKINNLSKQNPEFDIEKNEDGLNAGEISYIYFKFKPINTDLKNYIVPIDVFDFVKSIQNIEIKFEGKGYTNDEFKKLKNIENLNNKEICNKISSNINAYFSTEHIIFNSLKSNSFENKIIFLYNNNNEKNIQFNFLYTNVSCLDELKITPNKGEIKVGEFKEIFITLKTSNLPCFYDGEIECKILFIEDHKKYKNNLSINSGPSIELKEKDTDTIFLRITKTTDIKINELYNNSEFRKNKIFKNNDIKDNKNMIEIVTDSIFKDILIESNINKLNKKTLNQNKILFSNLDSNIKEEDNSEINNTSNINFNEIYKNCFISFYENITNELIKNVSNSDTIIKFPQSKNKFKKLMNQRTLLFKDFS